MAEQEPITTRPPDPSFYGYGIHTDGIVEQRFCPAPQKFTKSNNWCACVYAGITRGNFEFLKACAGGTATGIFGNLFPCNEGSSHCVTATLYATFPSESATTAWTEIRCVTESTLPFSALYLALPASTTSSASLSSAITGILTTTWLTLDNMYPKPSAPAPASEPASSSPKTWIAGAVLGLLIIIGLIGFLGFWLVRKRATKALIDPHLSQSNWYNANATGNNNVWSELDGNDPKAVAELSDAQHYFELGVPLHGHEQGAVELQANRA
ncbi:hypothetical protein QBC38DRAFT_492339 [Podospora fimiseda]|uniref:Uncharacterized protein n=1 Tax=Podospora fimiseda TaxID=252190 RepID=A0AAN7BGH3_9PEZI|nr:hypothetical protein QBC38DRAFT_492339 [Podospora fimiseda]